MKYYTTVEVCEHLGIRPHQLMYLLDVTAIDIDGQRQAFTLEEIATLRAYLPLPDDDSYMEEILADLHQRRIAIAPLNEIWQRLVQN